MKLEETMTEFVSREKFGITNQIIGIHEYYKKTSNYNSFITQELNIGMFVPAVFKDGEWVVLEKPLKTYYLHSQYMFEEAQKEYQEAKERVLFKDMYIKLSQQEDLIKSIVWKDVLHFYWYSEFNKKWMPSKGLKTIEDLIKYKLELTETGINKLKGEL